MEQINTGRLTVGQKYIFINIEYDRTVPTFTSLYLPWQDELRKINLELLECVEHHRVPNAFDVEKKPAYDGYVLRDAEGDLWHNQYPEAEFGQMSSADGYAYKNKDDDTGRYEIASDFFATLNRSLLGPDFQKPEMAEKFLSLFMFKQKLLAEIAEKYQMYAVETPRIVRLIDKPAVIRLNGMKTTFQSV